ncbi:Ulp1 family isopeptidase [Cysteiniphilum litorale]|uniref:Ulp1 family isopeptidase n=1 Tax=Cysteiniphilum litorale TaxID=2056700 RepID=UPI003F884E94
MNDFECIDKALSIVYMQDDLLAMLSLTQILGEEGVSIYTAAKDKLDKLLAALKKLDPITVGEGLSKISLIDLITQIERQSTKARALLLLQKHHHELVTSVNLQASIKKKDSTIHAVPVILYSYTLIQSIYGAVPIAKLLTAVHELTKREDGYTYALEQMKNAPNAPYYLYGLLMPSIIVSDNNSNERAFLEKLDKQYRQSGRHKKIDKRLRQKKLEADYYYEILYYVFDYFSKFENYREAYNQLAASTRESESYYIISKDLYRDFPKSIQGLIDERLRAVLVNAQSTQTKANKYFKELEAIKLQAESLKEYKSKRLDVGLKQSILLMKLNLAVAMLHELGVRLSSLDIEVKEQLTLPKETVVNTRKLPRFLHWQESLDELMAQLTNKQDSFACLVYHKLMSAILAKYDALSKVYDEIYTDTIYDDKAIRGVVEKKAKMIASIQMNPIKLLGDVCRENHLQEKDQAVVTKLFTESHSQMIPIMENCLEEFCYSVPQSAKKQYQLAMKETHRHPLYPLVTIYGEWYKLRSFILFFERFGNSVSSYFVGFEEVNGLAFEFLYQDLVYLSYLFGAIYNELEQSAQAMLLKYMSIFAITPNHQSYYLAFKKFAIIESCIFRHPAFEKMSFLEVINNYIEKENLVLSPHFREFAKQHRTARNGFTISALNKEQATYTISYQVNGQLRFNMLITAKELAESEDEVNQLYELGGVTALASVAMIAFIKGYNDQFLVETYLKMIEEKNLTIANIKGFYTTDIFSAWRTAGVKHHGVILRLVDLDSDLMALECLLLELNKYETSQSEKRQANDFLKRQCENFIGCFKKKVRIDLGQFNRIIIAVKRMLATKVIIKAIGSSACKKNLERAQQVFSQLHQKLIYVDICCFSQHAIAGLKPFKANRSFIEMMAYYLTKTFARNDEVIVTRHMDLPMLQGVDVSEDKTRQLVLKKTDENRLVFQTSYEQDCEILGIIHDSETGREVVPRDTSNKFYVFLKMLTKMCEYYMDAIMQIFGVMYDRGDYERYDQFLDKLLEDFQIAINTEFKKTKLDPLVSSFNLNQSLINLYVVFTLKSDSEHFKKDNGLDLYLLQGFIDESVSYLTVRSFDKVKFFDSSYREFSLIERFTGVYAELESLYGFMKDNEDFIILSKSDLFEIYNIKDDKELKTRLAQPADKQLLTLKGIFDDKRTKCFKLEILKFAVDSYQRYLTDHVIFPEYNENVVLACGLLCYEYHQIITIIYQDLLESSEGYQGIYKYKWWHLASLGIGAAVDYVYTTTHLAKGIKEIQSVIANDKIDANLQIEQIMAIARKRLQKDSERKDDVRRLYEFLSRELSAYVVNKQKYNDQHKVKFRFEPMSQNSEKSFEEYMYYLKKQRPNVSKKKSDVVGDVEVLADIDENDPRLVLISQNLQPLYLLDPVLRSGMALDIVQDITSHNLGRSSLISNGFVDICIGKLHQNNPVNLNLVERFVMKPCRTVLSNEIEQGDILHDIDQLIIASPHSLVMVPINFGNWHFVLLIIDTTNKRLYFFDSYGDGRVAWLRSNIKEKIPSIRAFQLENLTVNFQRNNDCGFLVLSLIDQLYLRNRRDINMQDLYQSVKDEYDSSFLRQYFCHFAGEPYSADSWVFNI